MYKIKRMVLASAKPKNKLEYNTYYPESISDCEEYLKKFGIGGFNEFKKGLKPTASIINLKVYHADKIGYLHKSSHSDYSRPEPFSVAKVFKEGDVVAVKIKYRYWRNAREEHDFLYTKACDGISVLKYFEGLLEKGVCIQATPRVNSLKSKNVEDLFISNEDELRRLLKPPFKVPYFDYKVLETEKEVEEAKRKYVLDNL